MKRITAILCLLPLAPAGALAQADDAAVTGLRLFNQSCRVCHTPPQSGSAQYGPVLSRDSLGGQDEALRAFIANGSPRMPGFKSHFRQEEMSALVAYLKTLPPAPVRGAEPG